MRSLLQPSLAPPGAPRSAWPSPSWPGTRTLPSALNRPLPGRRRLPGGHRRCCPRGCGWMLPSHRPWQVSPSCRDRGRTRACACRRTAGGHRSRAAARLRRAALGRSGGCRRRCRWRRRAPRPVPRTPDVPVPARRVRWARVRPAHARPPPPSAPADRPRPALRVRAPARPAAARAPALQRCAAVGRDGRVNRADFAFAHLDVTHLRCAHGQLRVRTAVVPAAPAPVECCARARWACCRAVRR